MIAPQKSYVVSDRDTDERMELMEQALSEAGTPFRRIEGDRTVARQAYLYASGRTRPGLIVTHCDGVEHPSNHQSGRAADYWPVNGHGAVFCPRADDAAWEILAEAAEAHGLASGLRWPDDRRDPAHIEAIQEVTK